MDISEPRRFLPQKIHGEGLPYEPHITTPITQNYTMDMKRNGNTSRKE